MSPRVPRAPHAACKEEGSGEEVAGTLSYDAIVVGARLAGSATALRLARRGWRVLLLDAATFPSDTLSTHLLWSDALRAFADLGLLDAVLATGAPPLTRLCLTYGAARNVAPIPTTPPYPPLLSVRRIVLDNILVEQVRQEVGITFWEGCLVDGLLWEGETVVGVRGRRHGHEVVEARARLVIGADGRHSRVARLVAAVEYDVVPPLLATYYGYWRGIALPDEPALAAYRDAQGGYCYLFPCDAGFWTVAISMPQQRFPDVRRDHERAVAEEIARKPELARRLAGAVRVGPLRGAGDLVNFFRVPRGPGWALTGDAGYHRDPITARGIPDALHSAALLAGALDRAWRGELPLGEALAEYQAARDALVKPLYDFTCERPPAGVEPAIWRRYLGGILTDADRLSAYAGFMAGVTPPDAFYSAAAVYAAVG